MAFDFQEYIDGLEKKARENNIGKMLAAGIGVGLDENSFLAVTAMENVYVELETLTKNAEKNAANLAKKRQKRELANLKNSKELLLITEQEYYEKLKKYRDENLRQGSDLWYKVTDEIIKYNRRLADEAVEEQIEAAKKQLEVAQKIKELKDELADNLMEDGTPWTDSETVRFLGAGPGGGDMVFHSEKINDFKDEIKILEQFRDMVLKLDGLGYMPDRFFSEIAEMDVGEAVSVMQKLLAADDEVRRAFAEGYGKKITLADSIASELNGILNRESLEEAGIAAYNPADAGSTQNVFLKQLEQNFEDVPPGYYMFGEKLGDAFDDGIETSIAKVMEEARNQVLDFVNGLASEFVSGIKLVKDSVVESTSNIYNTNYTFNASRDTTSVQLATARNAAIMDKLRGVS